MLQHAHQALQKYCQIFHEAASWNGLISPHTCLVLAVWVLCHIILCQAQWWISFTLFCSSFSVTNVCSPGRGSKFSVVDQKVLLEPVICWPSDTWCHRSHSLSLSFICHESTIVTHACIRSNINTQRLCHAHGLGSARVYAPLRVWCVLYCVVLTELDWSSSRKWMLCHEVQHSREGSVVVARNVCETSWCAYFLRKELAVTFQLLKASSAFSSFLNFTSNCFGTKQCDVHWASLSTAFSICWHAVVLEC